MFTLLVGFLYNTIGVVFKTKKQSNLIKMQRANFFYPNQAQQKLVP